MATYRERLFEIIFEHDSPAGKLFDVILACVILISVAVVMADSVASLRQEYGHVLIWLEWLFTILFTLEYGLRLYCARSSLAYAGSFFGIVDLLAILPTYIGLLLPGSHYLTVIRSLRLLRIFRVLKFVQYVSAASQLATALRASSRRITVFLLSVFTLVIILGTVMYVIEGETNGFTSIPRSVYWAIVTLTTVGYGDISPQTGLGQTLAALIMIIGYSIIAVPTGIVTVEMSRTPARGTKRTCSECEAGGHQPDALFCRKCAAVLPEGPASKKKRT